MSRPAGPPADVPTLTEVVDLPPARENLSHELQELVIQRLMLKVDLVLMPRFREELARVVRESVEQAFAQSPARPESHN